MLLDDHVKAKSAVDTKKEEDEIVIKTITNDQVGFDESGLLNMPLDVLAMIIKFCVGVEYMNFRATCRCCHLAAPLIQWRNETALKNYSLVSPWLMVLQRHRGVITFKDPLLGGDYYMKNSQKSVFVEKIYCSRFGWVVFKMTGTHLVFFNAFTNDLHKLPELHHSLDSLYFSAPPTSPDCMVIGFGGVRDWLVHFHFVAGNPTWRTFSLGIRKPPLCLSTLFGRDLYALSTG
uniref:uncharacterized protein LOC122590026 isoform X2 n=1 Tax=Erigeron canadensis TaxID=72917 RepID=UPI001CB99BA6|nr:uncharacterized protein LOC122590026 isoform X2 [Erigeron canadensis]